MDEKKKFVITRGMVLIGVILLLIILILLIIFVKPKKKANKSSVTKEDCKKLEERIKEEAPMYVYQKNLELTSDPLKINLDDLLSKNGGTIIESKYKAVSICKGYVVATKVDVEEYNPYISCEKIYTTKGYVDADNKITTTTTKKVIDNEKPVITFVGDSVIEINLGDNYVEQGAKATDNIDGDITSMIKVSGEVDSNNVGEYIIKYMVMDSSSNASETERKIIVKNGFTTTTKAPVITTTKGRVTSVRKTTAAPKTPPTIVLLGNSVINIEVGQPYVDPGYTAVDSLGNNITSRVNVTGSVNTKVSGNYTLVYSVSDVYGNKSSTKRTVVVKKNTIVEVKGISLTPNYSELNVNASLKLRVEISPSNATYKTITWSSDNNGIAIVSSDGTITAISRGTTWIRARSNNGIEARAKVYVK